MYAVMPKELWPFRHVSSYLTVAIMLHCSPSINMSFGPYVLAFPVVCNFDAVVVEFIFVGFSVMGLLDRAAVGTANAGNIIQPTVLLEVRILLVAKVGQMLNLLRREWLAVVGRVADVFCQLDEVFLTHGSLIFRFWLVRSSGGLPFVGLAFLKQVRIR